MTADELADTLIDEAHEHFRNWSCRCGKAHHSDCPCAGEAEHVCRAHRWEARVRQLVADFAKGRR